MPPTPETNNGTDSGAGNNTDNNTDNGTDNGTDSRRFERLRQTSSLRGDAHARWSDSTILVVGAGALGSVLAPEVTRSGARVIVCDPESGALENLGTQRVDAGVPKARSVVRGCNAQRFDSARALVADIRDVGVGTVCQADAIVDATDDPRLARPLTELSNGLGIPLVRVAVDGSGEREFGRVMVSDGGGGHACQLCSWSTADLFRGRESTPCPGRVLEGARASTRAGGALSMAVCGLALLQLQRLLGGLHREQAVDRELLLDLDHGQLHSLELERSANCLTGHESWALTAWDRTVGQATVRDLFTLAQRSLCAGGSPGADAADDTDGLTLEPWAQPLCLLAQCEACGRQEESVGTAGATPPPCAECGQPMSRRRDHRWPRFSRAQAERVGILDVRLSTLGLHPDGALVTARRPGRPVLRLLLAPDASEHDKPFEGPTTRRGLQRQALAGPAVAALRRRSPSHIRPGVSP